MSASATLPTRPTMDEVLHYYHGLPSQPLLVARTSTTPFPPAPPALTPMEAAERAFPYATEWWPGALFKSIGPIDGTSEAQQQHQQHKIVRVWCPAMRDELVSALEASPLAACWTSMYTLRITSEWTRAPDRVLPTSEVVLFIGIDVGSNPASSIPDYEDALQAAQACRGVLLAWKVHDVEVEVLTASIVGLEDSSSQSSNGASTSNSESTTTNLEALVDFRYETAGAMLQKFDLPMEMDEYDFPHAFLDYPGQRVEKTHPTVEGNRPSGAWGSLGLYLGLGGSEVYALTSRHVALGTRLPSDQLVKQDDHIPLLWGTQESLRTYATRLRERASLFQSEIEGLAKSFARLMEKQPEGDADDEANIVEAQMTERTRYANDYLSRLAAAVETLASRAPTTGNTASIPRERLLGSVAYSAPHSRTRHGAWTDWALVQLIEDRKRIVQGHEQANMVHVGFPPAMFRSPILPSPRQLTGFTHNGFVPLRAPVSDATGTASSLAFRHPRWVAKRGAKTGLTYGLTAELEAVFRRPLADGAFVIAYALLVLGHSSNNNTFSLPGDSGSAVFDMEGKIVGMLDAGIGSVDKERLLRFFHRPGDPGELPSDPSAVAEAAERAMAVAEGEEPSPFRPLRMEALLGEPVTSSVRPDITMVTPIEWVFNSIAEVTGSRPVVL